MKVRIEIIIPKFVDGRSDLDAYIGNWICDAAEEITIDGADANPSYIIVEDD